MVWLWVLLAFALTPVLGGTFWALATEGRRNHPKWGVFRSVQYAHRGLHNRELGVPENSMAAFRKARELGYGVELDVHLTKDGQLAVIHDKSLKRTAGVDAEVSDLTMEELKRCRLEGTQETIPALEEAARLFQGGPPLLVELKADYFDVRELVKKAVAVLDRCQVDYCIESFHPGVIFWLQAPPPGHLPGAAVPELLAAPGGAERLAGLRHDQPAVQFPHPPGLYLLSLGPPHAPGGVAVPAASPAARVLLDGAEPADHGAGGAGGMSGDL